MATSFGLIFCLCIFCWIQGSNGETCYEYDSWDFKTTTLYCSGGCCGTRYNRYCCYERDNWNPTGVIVGCSIGGIVFLGLIITGCVCICVKNKGSAGGVVAPTTGPTVIVAQCHQRSDGYGYQPISQYPYGTGQNFTSMTTATTSAGQGFAAYPGQVAPPPYSGPSGGAYPATSGEKSSFQS